MIKKQYIEMEDTETGLIGTGKISYHYTYIDRKHRLVIRWHSLEQDITYTGTKAKSMWLRVINDTHMETINLVKRLACDSVGIPLIRIKENSRKREVVWARNMVMWFANKYLRYSLEASGDLFSRDHATAIHGIREFNKEYKYLPEKQSLWKGLFLKKCINRSLFVQ